MNFIQFESGRDKDKIRQELREARDQMLEKAKQRAEQRIQREKEMELRGERNWILPAVAAKFDKLHKSNSKTSKKSKKKKGKEKTSKKSKKPRKTEKKRKESSSSSSDSDTDSDTDSESDSDSDSSSDEGEKKRKTKKNSKKHRKRKYSTSSSSSSDTTSSSNSSSTSSSDDNTAQRKHKKATTCTSPKSDDDDQLEAAVTEWVERPQCSTIATSKPIQRDSWMTEPPLLKTYARERKENEPNAEQRRIDAYDPAKSARELNPYWKSTGTGLPAFRKPTDRDDDGQEGFMKQRSKQVGSSGSGGWRKQQNVDSSSSSIRNAKQDSPAIASTSSSDEASADEQAAEPQTFLTDQQMNELGAKLLKAEIMGNAELAAELKTKLEVARQNRTAVKERRPEQTATKQKHTQKSRKQVEDDEDHVLLTRTDERGNTRPLAQASRQLDPRELYGGRSGRKKQKRVDTHLDGERVRYFPDDDKYDIKQMFEREKYSSAGESNMQFANIAGKHKNPNDDLDDIFADNVRKNISQEETDRKEMQRAINEHKRMSAQLESCTRCFDSAKMDKSLLVSMGEQVYLSLPWHIGLQPGHCIIAPTQHISCCTQLDEDTWTELVDFRKALTRMFAAQRKDVIFFEIANKLQRRPHLSIHCVPIPESEAEMAPFYFKKAIEESEHEWSVNKQLVSLRGKNLRSCIPKGLPYFWVNFGMDTGFAHVIEDEDRFPANFAQEIIGGMLQLDANKWRRQQKEQNSIAKVKMFADWWKKYDCTK